jgi:hypothetical protein
MKFLNTILSCLTVIALLVSTSGVNVVYHYCSDELETVSLGTAPACDCEHDDISADDAANTPCTKDCCTTTVHTLKTTDSFVLTMQKDIASKATILAVLPVVVFYSQPVYAVQQTSFFLDTSPPHSENIPVRFRALLI